MSRIVMKFGGTSVGSVDRIKNVSNIVQSVYDEGHEVVVVLSAMAGDTDRLLNITKDIYGPGKCEECSNVGYQGRVGVYEVLAITPTLSEMIGEATLDSDGRALNA